METQRHHGVERTAREVILKKLILIHTSLERGGWSAINLFPSRFNGFNETVKNGSGPCIRALTPLKQGVNEK